MSKKTLRKFVSFILIYFKLYIILADIGNEHCNGYVLPLHSIALLSESEVVFMSFILFLIITIMVSATINVALLAIIYIQYVNLIINKE